jgi:hypothetical protein
MAMTDKRDSRGEAMQKGRKSGFRESRNSTETLEFLPSRLGQCYPQQYPPLEIMNHPSIDPLGEPMTIREVAGLLGCSVWTVRQRHIPSGLPYFRIGDTGKLVFYRAQVVRWILEHQKKGG